MEILIKCTKCNVEKPETEFRKQSSTKTKRKAYCVSCDNLYQKQRYASKKPAYISNVLKWQKDNPEKVKGYKAKFSLKNKKTNASKVKKLEPIEVIPVVDNIQTC